MCIQITSTKPCGHLTLLAWVYDNPPDPLCNRTEKICPVRRLQIRKPHSQNCGTCQAIEYSKKCVKREEQAEKHRRVQDRDHALAKQKEMLKWLAKKREEQKKKLTTGNGGRYGWWGEKFFE